ncbi:hypothetical protein Nans01_28740 [Nocardiopsis ansamitocini]|uniref:N-acetyltransferase domain-containing protein n=1 Tax=Nocardiopsis ansamitocini TaxID=1670832 RepID=A0A9W6P7M9_9ACTN|nr:hypothetical protein Nans01_28740 [Nocardiopsis ansamitocini]
MSLRRPEPKDVEAVLAVHSDPLACAYNPFDAVFDLDGATERLAHWDEHWQQFGFGYRVIREHGSEQVLGFCGVKLTMLADRHVLNLFYRLAPEEWGRGVATEAASWTAWWAAEYLPVYPLVARVRSDNTASQRVALKAGLMRAPHLDDPGPDGLDWIFAARWPGVEPGVPSPGGVRVRSPRRVAGG